MTQSEIKAELIRIRSGVLSRRPQATQNDLSRLISELEKPQEGLSLNNSEYEIILEMWD